MSDTTRILRDALDRVVPIGRHALVLGEALRNGGLLDVPSDEAEFRAFVKGPLVQAATIHLGEAMAETLRTTLAGGLAAAGRPNGTLPLTAPIERPSERLTPGGASRAKTGEARGSTLAYGAERTTAPRPHVALVERDAELVGQLSDALEARGYRVIVSEAEGVAALCATASVRLLLVGHAHDRVLASVRALEAAPPIVFLSDESRRPAGVEAVLPRRFDPDLIRVIDIALRAGG